jgi:hypothetical protein
MSHLYLVEGQLSKYATFSHKVVADDPIEAMKKGIHHANTVQARYSDAEVDPFEISNVVKIERIELNVSYVI